MDDEFAVYKLRVEGLSVDVDNLVMYLIVTCNNETSVDTAEHVMHRKGLQSNVTFLLKVRDVNVITSTLKSRNSVVASTIPVISLPPTLIQEPVGLVQRKTISRRSLGF